MILDDKMKDMKVTRSYLKQIEEISNEFVSLPSIDVNCEDFIEYIINLIDKEISRVTKKLKLLESEVNKSE